MLIRDLEIIQQKSSFLAIPKDNEFSFTILFLVLIALVLWRSIILKKRLAKQSTLLAEQAIYLKEIQTKISQDAEIEEQKEHFRKNLEQAEITTELQKSRSSFVHQQNSQRPPERYEYARSMFQSGMSTEEISSALGMSTLEIAQLIKLSSLRGQAEQFKNDKDILSLA